MRGGEGGPAYLGSAETPMAGGGRSRGRPGEDEEVGRGRFWQLAFVAGSFVVASFSRWYITRPGRCGRGRRYGPLSVSSFSFGLFSILFEMVSGMAWMEPATASDQQASS
jgi:hypothetical protein